MGIFVIITSISFTIFTLLISRSAGKEILHLGAMISQRGSFDLTGFKPAMDLALETVEKDETLPFVFNVTLNDSMVRKYTKVCTEYLWKISASHIACCSHTRRDLSRMPRQPPS